MSQVLAMVAIVYSTGLIGAHMALNVHVLLVRVFESFLVATKNPSVHQFKSCLRSICFRGRMLVPIIVTHSSISDYRTRAAKDKP
jgi:hypothetical protein